MKKKALIITVIVILTAIVTLILSLVFVAPKHLQKLVDTDGITSVSVVHRTKLDSDSSAMESRTIDLNDEQVEAFINGLTKSSYYIRFADNEDVSSLFYVIEYENGNKISFDGYTIEKYNANNTLVFSKKIYLKKPFSID